SLTYLQELPIDGIKLDRRLVVNALRSRTDRLVLDSIVKLSTRIGHSVIAEGIETVDHLAAVAEVGCHLVQGYHLHRPMPGDDLISILCDQELRGRESMPVDEQRAEDPAANVADTNVADTNVTDTNVTGSIGHAPNDDWTLPLVSPTVDPFSPPSGAPLPEPIAADVISAEVIPADVIGVPTLPDRTVG
ncbi:MAG: EAL domain-containing protein, partial [Actinomycetota bacterium]